MKELYAVDSEGKVKLSLHRGQTQAWESRKRFVFVLAGSQGGKAVDINTLIPTPRGFVRMGDLRVGDKVYDENGVECEILFCSKIMNNRTCYEVKFDDGSSVIADADHQWYVQDRKQRKNQSRRPENSNSNWGNSRPQSRRSPDYSVKTTQEIKDGLFANSGIIRLRPAANYSIDICAPVDYPEKEYSLHPYVLGAWLGDGNSDNPLITSADEEIVDNIRSCEIEIEKVPYDSNSGMASLYRMGNSYRNSGGHPANTVKDCLRELNVLNNKHIPEEYLLGSVSQRFDLLHGLMDTDGYCAVDGTCEYTSVKIELANGLLELCRSLGIKARIKEKRAKLYGKDCGPKYCVSFSTDKIVFKLSRKIARQKKDFRAEVRRKYIVAVDLVDSIPVKCISVDSPSSLYIATRAYTVTHNTSFGVWWLWNEINRLGSGDYLAVAPSFPILNKKMLPEFLKIFNRLGMGRWWAANMTYEIFDPKTGRGATRYHDPMFARVMFCSAKNADSLESATAKAAWLDEVGQDDFRISAWEAVLRRLSLAQGRVLGTTTIYNLGWMKQQIYDAWKSGEDEDIDVIQFRSIDNPTFPVEEYYRAKRTMPAWKFNMFYNGEYDKPAGMIYDSFNMELCKIPPIPIPEHWPVYVGMDFGGVHMAGLFTAQDPDTKRFYHFEEYLRGNLSIAQHAEEFKKIVGNRPLKWIGGASPEDQWRLEFQQAGIPVMPPPIKEVEVGIARVYAFHKNNQIYVFDHLTRYLDEKGSYARKLDENNQPMEEIEHKNEYHILDAERVLFSDLWEREGMLSADVVKGMADTIRSRWQPVMPIMVTADNDTGGRWGRGRRF